PPVGLLRTGLPGAAQHLLGPLEIEAQRLGAPLEGLAPVIFIRKVVLQAGQEEAAELALRLRDPGKGVPLDEVPKKALRQVLGVLDVMPLAAVVLVAGFPVPLAPGPHLLPVPL